VLRLSLDPELQRASCVPALCAASSLAILTRNPAHLDPRSTALRTLIHAAQPVCLRPEPGYVRWYPQAERAAGRDNLGTDLYVNLYEKLYDLGPSMTQA
jgi:hypothetical protein